MSVKRQDQRRNTKPLSAQQGSTVAELSATNNYKLGDFDERPWGSWRVTDSGKSFVVKRVTVKSGETTSLHYHHGRNEHWIVVAGQATVTRGEDNYVLSENQTTYIPVGVAHRLQNHANEDVVLIEIQTGTLLDEADIVRLEDNYGRVNAP